MKRVLLSWSSGKDSAWCLHLLRQMPDVEVGALLTTVNEEFGRVAMHAVREEILEAQAGAAGLPLWRVPLPWPCSNDEYEQRVGEAVRRAAREGFTHAAFGDLFLEDIRAYREAKLAGTGLAPLFPVWGIPTGALAREMIAGGLRARLTCVDPRVLDPSFAGREFDASLLAALPPGIDPCGENGEFHTCVYAGPMFARPLDVQSGETVTRDGFVFTDLMLEAPGQARIKTCGACGQPFDCHAGNCWCDAVPLDDAARAELSARYDDCLCPACLSAFAIASSGTGQDTTSGCSTEASASTPSASDGPGLVK